VTSRWWNVGADGDGHGHVGSRSSPSRRTRRARNGSEGSPTSTGLDLQYIPIRGQASGWRIVGSATRGPCIAGGRRTGTGRLLAGGGPPEEGVKPRDVRDSRTARRDRVASRDARVSGDCSMTMLWADTTKAEPSEPVFLLACRREGDLKPQRPIPASAGRYPV